MARTEVFTLARETLYLSQTMSPAQASGRRSGLFRVHCLFVSLSEDLWFLESIEVNILIVSVCGACDWACCERVCVCVFGIHV